MTRNKLKLLAYTTMVIDHIGCLFFPSSWLFRIVGRITFPIFAFFTADSMVSCKNKKRYLLRLLILAIASEPIYDMVFGYEFLDKNFSVITTLALGALACYLSAISKAKVGVCAYFWFFLAAFLAEVSEMDYGCYGIFMIAMFYTAKECGGYDYIEQQHLLSLGILQLDSFIALLSGRHWVQGFAPLAAFLLPPTKADEKAMSKAWYLFYPVHLVVLHLIKQLGKF